MYNKANRNTRGNKKQRANVPKKKVKCSVHRGVIRGKVHYWNHQPMCHNCYIRFTVGGPNGGVTIIRAPKPPQKSFFQKLFGG